MYVSQTHEYTISQSSVECLSVSDFFLIRNNAATNTLLHKSLCVSPVPWMNVREWDATSTDVNILKTFDINYQIWPHPLRTLLKILVIAFIALFLKGFKKSVSLFPYMASYIGEGLWDSFSLVVFLMKINVFTFVFDRLGSRDIRYFVIWFYLVIIKLLLIFWYLCLVSNGSDHSETWGNFISLFPKMRSIEHAGAALS